VEEIMMMRKYRFIGPRAATAAALMPLLWLAACAADNAAVDDYYKPAMHYERFPIEVAKGAVRLDVSTRRPSLGERQEDAVARFAQAAQTSGARHIQVQRPRAAATADAVAGRVTQILVMSGIEPEAIVQREYGGGNRAPVIVTFQRKIAVTPECGDWSEDIAVTGKNEPPPDFGCATQNNIAAVVANPEDFEVPRTATAPDAMRRNQVFVDYRKPKNTATPVGESETQTVSEVAE
jgi:pilus assembly protein CpaD